MPALVALTFAVNAYFIIHQCSCFAMPWKLSARRPGELLLCAATQVMPALVAMTVLVNAYFIIYQGGAAFHWDRTPLWAASLIAGGLAAGAAALTHFGAQPAHARGD